jgi:hypothetical protein
MKNLNDTNKEYLISAGIGLIGLVLSFFIGILSGNSVFTVILRAFITLVILSLIGYGCIFVIKKYVPEIYEAVNSLKINENPEINIENPDVKAESKEENKDIEKTEKINPEESISELPDEAAAVSREDTKLEREFTEIERQPDDYSSSISSDDIPHKKSEDFFKDRKIKYEPKIAAQAIRTMMKRDE